MSSSRALFSGNEMRKLRRQCEAKLSNLPLPSDAFSVRALVANMEAASGRTIHLIEVEDARSDRRTACGLRIRGRHTTYILFRRRPTPHQTEHTILHELAHEWLDHHSTLSPREVLPSIPDSVWERIAADLGPDVVVQARSRYGTVEEREAELSATLIKIKLQRRAGAGKDPMSLLESSLSHPVAPPPAGMFRGCTDA
ncbi:hypothetical protein AB0D13_09695 [Streptomyces sp. NPDC048430]|uniref:hypothetical protein n=1 Tax=Streptomyces sp. NPDC048430 TaxID=3155388 RepID=UPI003418883D